MLPSRSLGDRVEVMGSGWPCAGMSFQASFLDFADSQIQTRNPNMLLQWEGMHCAISMEPSREHPPAADGCTTQST